MPPRGNRNTNNDRGRGRGRGGGGGRGRGSVRGAARGTERGGRGGRGGAFANAGPGVVLGADPQTTFIIPPPTPDLPNQRGGRGRGRGSRGRGRGASPSNSTPARGGRGGGGRGRGAGTSMLQDDLALVDKMFRSEGNPTSTHPSTLSVRGRGGSSSSTPRGTAHEGTYRRSSGIGLPPHQRGRGSNGGPGGGRDSYYKPIDPNGPLSSLLHRERPLLRPVLFVPAVHNRVLFADDFVQMVESVNGQLNEGGDGLRNEGGENPGDMTLATNLEYAAHAPTADRVMRVFSGALQRPPVVGSSDSEGVDDNGDGDEQYDNGGDNEEIEEIDFSDMGRLMASLDVNHTQTTTTPKKAKKKTRVVGYQESEERFMGVYVEPRRGQVGVVVEDAGAELGMQEGDDDILQVETEIVVDLEEEEVMVGVEHVHVESPHGENTVQVDTTTLTREMALSSDAQTTIPATDLQVPNALKGGADALNFIIDTEPIHTDPHDGTLNIAKPRIRTPPPLSALDDDDEVIVYVAPHPRRGEGDGPRDGRGEGKQTERESGKQREKKNGKDREEILGGEYTYTPYVGISGVTSGGVGPEGSNSRSIQTPTRRRRLGVPPLSTPRMAKSALAKQKKVARRTRATKSRRSFGFSGAFGGYGAMMQEKELRDEFGGMETDGRKDERRRGDSDLDWGDEDDEDEQDGGDEYMTFSELQRTVGSEEGGGNGKGKGRAVPLDVEEDQLEDEEGDVDNDSQGPFVVHVPSSSAKRRLRRKNALATAAGQSNHRQRKRNARIDATDMDVDSELEMDVDAMRQFAAGMLGSGAGTHVSMGDLEDEQRMREEDEDLNGSTDDDDDGDAEEDEEVEAAVEQAEEEMLAEDGLSGGDSDEDEDEDEDHPTPRTSFVARLEKHRELSRKQKGKARIDDDDQMDFDDDEFEEDLLEKSLKWAEDDEDELIGMVQDILDDNEELLNNRDRKARNKLFKAISNGEFDYFEDDFSFQPAKRGKKAKRAGIPADLQAQWDKDRETKALKKQQRQLEKLMQASDPFTPYKGGKKGRKATLAASRLTDPGIISVLPNRIIDLSTLVQMLHKFVNDLGGKQQLSLPPTDKETRKNVHELAVAFGLKSVSKGKGDGRYVTVVKTTRTGPGRVDERKVAKIVRRGGGAGARGNDFTSGANAYRGGGARMMPPKHKEGEVVGKAAPKIDASNVGFRMLAMMGWSVGERIGTEGLDAPVAAIIKHSKLGLGAS